MSKNHLSQSHRPLPHEWGEEVCESAPALVSAPARHVTQTPFQWGILSYMPKRCAKEIGRAHV